jgi:ABC-type phosphate transport system permease subunit
MSKVCGCLCPAEPREANTEGGIFPAIFGTVSHGFLMTLAVMPFGVMAAVYLREYAKQGLLVRLVRIAVNNLAGVPSIVFGVFGLAFFVYALAWHDRPMVVSRGAARIPPSAPAAFCGLL